MNNKIKDHDEASMLNESLVANILQSLKVQREDFVVTLNHDIRSPVNSTIRAIEMLVNENCGPLQKNQASLLFTVLESNQSIKNLLSKMIDIYKYENGAVRLSLQRNDLTKVASQIVRIMQPIARERKVNLNFKNNGPSESVICDVEEIRRVIQNITENALNYTDPGGQVEISVQQTGQTTTLIVNDNGRGISDKDQQYLLKRFWTPLLSGNKFASTGLGLYLCRKIIEHHCGDIDFESQVGIGSTFYVELPNDGPKPKSKERMVTGKLSEIISQPISVMVVDDNRFLRKCLRRTLLNSGFIYAGEADCAGEASSAYERLKPDVVIMDISLPDGNGIDIVENICQKDLSAKIVMYSSHDDAISVSSSLAAGASGYCTKGTEPGRLEMAIRSVYSGAIWLDAPAARKLKEYTRIFAE